MRPSAICASIAPPTVLAKHFRCTILALRANTTVLTDALSSTVLALIALSATLTDALPPTVLWVGGWSNSKFSICLFVGRGRRASCTLSGTPHSTEIPTTSLSCPSPPSAQTWIVLTPLAPTEERSERGGAPTRRTIRKSPSINGSRDTRSQGCGTSNSVHCQSFGIASSRNFNSDTPTPPPSSPVSTPFTNLQRHPSWILGDLSSPHLTPTTDARTVQDSETTHHPTPTHPAQGTLP
uniref:Uncharacterized protein n=1 Tax=Chromera velia CCMP2878 TaxID=1169474 RepID=A0A0G4I2B8_9ALVE|eukprot:Cvel_10350.t1-p1 / transcript=Cvel_10350.t1 / gene=Cvel_10350 / organism=Chromera_velia_CCMP2878 / gene_product=hypothetical protein / transcript_product=hypothetical protein / location=Cvel_scaffold622:28651-29574(-) / protein_length=237 / sequence_SO=supercontig / SO=protein_coding / is_pseudo=false